LDDKHGPAQPQAVQLVQLFPSFQSAMALEQLSFINVTSPARKYLIDASSPLGRGGWLPPQNRELLQYGDFVKHQ
jgi:hypothetical protein